MVVYNYNGMRNDGLILRKGMPLLWQFDGGYVDLDANGTPTSWNYYVTDHLGSTRMVVDSNDSIKEVINYYPFDCEMELRATDEKARQQLMELLGGASMSAIQHLEKDERNAIIGRLRAFGASIRQISRLTGVSEGIVRKIPPSTQ